MLTARKEILNEAKLLEEQNEKKRAMPLFQKLECRKARARDFTKKVSSSVGSRKWQNQFSFYYETPDVPGMGITGGCKDNGCRSEKSPLLEGLVRQNDPQIPLSAECKVLNWGILESRIQESISMTPILKKF